MGLAASQARFLAITARKADCEFRSMQIAQNKLSVTRELQAATEKYQNSLNAEMLIWDYDGTSSDLQAVSYSLMTKPSVYNNFTPYLLTDRGGRVIVSKEIAAAAAAAGIDPNKGGSRTESAFNQFINALASNNVISTQTVKQMTEAMYIVNNPSNMYKGLDGNMYKASSTCPYAVPVYVSKSTNSNGSIKYNYEGAVLADNPNWYSDIINYPPTSYTNPDTGETIQLVNQFAVPVYVDADGNPCKDSNGNIIPVLKENKYYTDMQAAGMTTTDSNGGDRRANEKYYSGDKNEPPSNAANISYAVWIDSSLSEVGSPKSILQKLQANDSNVKLINSVNSFDALDYYTGARNLKPYDMAYAIYTGPKNLDITSPQGIIDNIDNKYIKFVEYSNYDPDNGYGSEPMSKNALTGMNLGQLANALKDGYVTNAFDEIKLENILVSQYKNDLVCGNGQSYSAEKNGVTYSSSSFDVISLSDVLTGNVVLYGHHEDGDHDYHADFNKFLDNYLKNAVIQIGIALGAYEEGTTDPANSTSYKDNDLGSMFAMAYQFTQAAFCEGASTVTTRKNGDSDTQKLAIEEAEATNHTIFYKNSGKDYNSTSAVSLSNMMSYFLTYVTILEDGFDSGYAVTDKVADSYFVTNDPSYRWVVNDEETETNEAVMKSDFYQQLFNNLCINGYKTDQRVKEDNDYLEQMLKNGSYFISSLGHDGHFYQTRYNDSENTLIKVVADEDAIAVAESEYNYMKIKLTAKEDKLDLDMKNIDLEISSLTTEYDSVKNLIAKSIEKTFKQFEG